MYLFFMGKYNFLWNYTAYILKNRVNKLPTAKVVETFFDKHIYKNLVF